VRIPGRGTRIAAPKVLITAPLGVLQAGAIRFEPAPDNLRAACEGIAMGDAARIALRFRRPVWHAREEFRHLGFLHTGEDWMPTWWTTLPIESPVITGWTGGPAAEERANMDPTQWVGDAIATLARQLRTDEATLAGELQSWHAHNWHTDPYSRGAYSYVRVGGLEAHRRFGDPVEDTLYFAGEAVNTLGHIGTVHGAMASGERAARLIVADRTRVSR
jgi:monoamine oxidase